MKRYAAILAISVLIYGLVSCAQTTPAPSSITPLSIASLPDENTVVLVLEDPRPLHRQRGLGTPGYTSRQAYDVDPLLARTARAVSLDLGVELLTQWPIRSQKLLCLLVSSAGKDADELIRSALKDKRVKMAQPFNRFETLATPEPYQHLQAFDASHLESIAAGNTGKAGRILVVDTFADLKHEDLRHADIQQYDFVGQKRGFAQELHGTAVVGVLAAASSNGIGIAGIAPDAIVKVARACWQKHSSSSAAVCNTLTLSAALDFAIENNFDLLNLSLSGPLDPLLEMLLDEVLAKGTKIVTAFDPKRARVKRFPKWREQGGVLFAVGSQSEAGDLWPWEISAPYSAITLQPNNRYDVVSGHSIAAPHVAGLTALLLEGKPRLQHSEIDLRLQQISYSVESKYHQAK